MPLSEQEKRALEELEAQLAAEDPCFASAMDSDPQRAQRRRRLLLGGAGVLVGVALLVLAVVVRQPLVGVVGFLGVTLGVAHILSEPKHALHVVTPNGLMAASSGRAPRRRATGTSPGGAGQRDFMSTLESRWERRRRENQGW